MPFLGCVLLALVAAVVGGFVFMEIGEVVFAFIDEFAPGFFPGCYSELIPLSKHGFDVPRKFAWGDILMSTAICGVGCMGSVTLLITGLRLGSAMSVLRASVIVCLGGLACACAGGGGGYLLGVAVPGSVRGLFRAGGEAWFNPPQVGLGVGVWQGFLAGSTVGAVVAVVVAWFRGRL